MKLVYMDGAENTFIIVDCLNERSSFRKAPNAPEDRAEWTRSLCLKVPGFLPDGVVFLEPQTTGLLPLNQAQFVWDFYNADGSNSEFCGNAARCAAAYYQQRVQAISKIIFQTRAGVCEAEVFADPGGSPQLKQVRVRMPRAAETPILLAAAEAEGHEAYFVDSGVPHIVVPGAADVVLAKKLRPPTLKRPRGANVTFVEKIPPESKGFLARFSAVSFERGVEGFTRACGTGAVAAGLYLSKIRNEVGILGLQMPGGLLLVDIQDSGQVFLQGPTRLHFQLELQ